MGSMDLSIGMRITSGIVAPSIAFALADLASLEFELDPSDSSTITLNGSDVSKWTDKVNSYEYVQGTASKQPALNTAGIGGLDSVFFDTSGSPGHILTGPNITLGQGSFTMFAIHNSSGSSNNTWFAQGRAADNFHDWQFGSHFTGNKRVRCTGNISFDGVVDVYEGTDMLLTFRSDKVGSAQDLWVDGALSASDTDTPGDITPDQSSIGGAFGSTEGAYWIGDIGHIVGYATNHTDGDNDSVEALLATQWGITI